MLLFHIFFLNRSGAERTWGLQMGNSRIWHLTHPGKRLRMKQATAESKSHLEAFFGLNYGADLYKEQDRSSSMLGNSAGLLCHRWPHLAESLLWNLSHIIVDLTRSNYENLKVKEKGESRRFMSRRFRRQIQGESVFLWYKTAYFNQDGLERSECVVPRKDKTKQNPNSYKGTKQVNKCYVCKVTNSLSDQDF